jgi:hypothetical protein
LNRCWPPQNKAHQRRSNEQTEIFLKQSDTNSVKVRTNVERYGQQKNKKRRSRFIIRPAGIFFVSFFSQFVGGVSVSFDGSADARNESIDQIQTATMFSTNGNETTEYCGA